MPECHQRIGGPQPPKGRGSWTDQPYIECRVTDPVLIPEADQRQPQTSPTGRNPKPQTRYAPLEKPATTIEGGKRHRTTFQGAPRECHGRQCRRPRSHRTRPGVLHAPYPQLLFLEECKHCS